MKVKQSAVAYFVYVFYPHGQKKKKKKKKKKA